MEEIKKRDAFYMLRSYVDMIRDMSPEDAKAYVLALADYALDGTSPTLEGIAKIAFQGSKVPLDKSITNRLNGQKGGAPKGNQNARKTTQNNRKTTENNRKQPTVDWVDLTDVSVKTTQNNRKTTENNRKQADKDALMVTSTCNITSNNNNNKNNNNNINKNNNDIVTGTDSNQVTSNKITKKENKEKKEKVTYSDSNLVGEDFPNDDFEEGYWESAEVTDGEDTYSPDNDYQQVVYSPSSLDIFFREKLKEGNNVRWVTDYSDYGSLSCQTEFNRWVLDNQLDTIQVERLWKEYRQKYLSNEKNSIDVSQGTDKAIYDYLRGYRLNDYLRGTFQTACRDNQRLLEDWMDENQYSRSRVELIFNLVNKELRG